MLMLSRGEYRAAVAPNEIGEIMPLINQYKKQFDERLAGMKESLSDNKEFDDEVAAIEKSYADYSNLSAQTYALAEKYKNLQTTQEQQEIYKSVVEARKKATEVTDMITKVNADLSNSNDELEKQTKELSATIERMMILVALGGLMAGLIVGLYIF